MDSQDSQTFNDIDIIAVKNSATIKQLESKVGSCMRKLAGLRDLVNKNVQIIASVTADLNEIYTCIDKLKEGRCETDNSCTSNEIVIKEERVEVSDEQEVQEEQYFTNEPIVNVLVEPSIHQNTPGPSCHVDHNSVNNSTRDQKIKGKSNQGSQKLQENWIKDGILLIDGMLEFVKSTPGYSSNSNEEKVYFKVNSIKEALMRRAFSTPKMFDYEVIRILKNLDMCENLVRELNQLYQNRKTEIFSKYCSSLTSNLSKTNTDISFDHVEYSQPRGFASPESRPFIEPVGVVPVGIVPMELMEFINNHEANNCISLGEQEFEKALDQPDTPYTHFMNKPVVENNEKSKSQNEKKRQRQESKWIDVAAKKARAEGKEGMGRRKPIIAKKIKPDCGDQCRRKCNQKYTSDDRQYAFNNYWKLGNKWKQWTFLNNWVSVKTKDKESMEVDELLGKKCRFIYELPTSNGTPVRVCQTMFINTLDISLQVIRTAKQKGKKMDSTKVIEDLRGKHKNRFSYSEETKEKVRQHVRDFSVMKDRENSNHVYLEEGMSVAKLYKLFTEKYSNDPKIISISVYRSILNSDLNIEYLKKKKD